MYLFMISVFVFIMLPSFVHCATRLLDYMRDMYISISLTFLLR